MADSDDLIVSTSTSRVRSTVSDDIATKLSEPEVEERELLEEEVLDSARAFEDSADLVGAPSTEDLGDADQLDVFGGSLGGGTDLLNGDGKDDLTALDGDRGDTSELLDGFGSDEPDFIRGDDTSTMAAGTGTTLTGFGHSITIGDDGVTTSEADDGTFGMSVSVGGVSVGVETGDDGTTISGGGVDLTFGGGADDGTTPTDGDDGASGGLTGDTTSGATSGGTTDSGDDGSGTDVVGVSGSVAGFGVGVSYNTSTGVDVTVETGETDNTGASVTVGGVTVTAGDDPTPSDTDDSGETSGSGDSGDSEDTSGSDDSDGGDDGDDTDDGDDDADDEETVDDTEGSDSGFSTGEEGEQVIDVAAAMKRVEVIGDSRVQPTDDGEGGGSGDGGPLLQERLDGGDIDPAEDDGTGVDTELDTSRIFNTVQPRFGNDDAGVPTIGGLAPGGDDLGFEATTAFEADDLGLDDDAFEVGQESGDDSFDFDLDG